MSTEWVAQKATPREGKAQRNRELGDWRGQPAGAHMRRVALCAGALGVCPGKGAGEAAARDGPQRLLGPLAAGAGKEGEGEPKGAERWAGVASPSPRSGSLSRCGAGLQPLQLGFPL